MNIPFLHTERFLGVLLHCFGLLGLFIKCGGFGAPGVWEKEVVAGKEKPLLVAGTGRDMSLVARLSSLVKRRTSLVT